METNTTTTTKKKLTKGRQKIEMKMIQDEEDRLITFSKRRSGVYKKASELVTLCGAEVGVVIFSPSGKPFSYGHPSIDAVAARLLFDQANPPAAGTATEAATHPIIEAHRRVRINELNQQYNDMFAYLEAEKERRKGLQKMTLVGEAETEEAVAAAGAATEGWWDKRIEGLSLDELKQRQRSLQELHANISNHIKERMTMSLNSFNNNNNDNDATTPVGALGLGASSSFTRVGGSSSGQKSGLFSNQTQHQRASGHPLAPHAYPHLGYGYGYGHGHEHN